MRRTINFIYTVIMVMVLIMQTAEFTEWIGDKIKKNSKDKDEAKSGNGSFEEIEAEHETA